MLLRRLDRADMAAAAAVHRAAYDAALPWLAGRHTPAEDVAFYATRVFANRPVWGVFLGDRLAGVMALRPGWIDQLYIAPAEQAQGLGSALVAQAKAANETLQLFTFQRNTPARRFYERQGFTIAALSDGAANEEGEPDALYRWRSDRAVRPPPPPL